MTAERRPTPRPGSPQPDGVNDRFAVGEVGQTVTPCAEGFICQQVGLRESRCVRQDKMSKWFHRLLHVCHSGLPLWVWGQCNGVFVQKCLPICVNWKIKGCPN